MVYVFSNRQDQHTSEVWLKFVILLKNALWNLVQNSDKENLPVWGILECVWKCACLNL